MRLSPKALATLRRSLARRKRLYATVTVTAVDASGNRSWAQRRIRVR